MFIKVECTEFVSLFPHFVACGQHHTTSHETEIVKRLCTRVKLRHFRHCTHCVLLFKESCGFWQLTATYVIITQSDNVVDLMKCSAV